MPANGRGIQGATSHMLGQNFSKMFKIWFEDKEKQKDFAWQTSWGISTRSIGALIMIHGDNKGLVLPPRIAPIQAVLVPIIHKSDDEDAIVQRLKVLEKQLIELGVRTRLDNRVRSV